MRIVELFSGIGSQAKALTNINVQDLEVVHTCEWDVHSFCAYDLIHNGPELHQEAIGLSKDELLERLERFTLSLDGKEAMKEATRRSLRLDVLRQIYSSILKTNNLVNISDVHGADIGDNIDLMTYSFPCQDLSNVGSFHGYNRGIDRNSGSRSSLLWEVERILQERQIAGLDLPRFLMLENVPSLLSTRHRTNFQEWINNLSALGYKSRYFRLMATDFGLPQTRYRLIMISVFTGNNIEIDNIVEEFFNEHNLELANYRNQLNIQNRNLDEFLRFNYQDRQIWAEALSMQPNDTESRRRIWEDNPKITVAENPNQPIILNVATLTTKQDRHPNSGNIYFNYPGNTKSHFRYLTPRECFLLMGYDEADYEVLINNNIQARANSVFFYRDKLIRLAGNSIAVPVLEYVFQEILDLKEILDREND